MEDNEPADIADPAASESAGAIRIALDGAQATSSEPGPEITPGQLRITAAGTYLLSGSYTGNIAVEAPANSDVVLILDGAHILASGGSAIEGRSAGTLAVLYAANTSNIVRDDGGNASSPASDDGAAIRSTPPLSLGGGLAGGGSLEVHGATTGIEATGSLATTGGQLSVEAGGDALSSSHSVTLSSPSVQLTAGGTGVVAKSDEEDRGYIDLYSGAVSVTARWDGLAASGDVRLRGGSLEVHTADGAEVEIPEGASAKAVSSGDAILVEDGAHHIDAGEHGLAANGPLALTGGELSIAANNKGVRSRSEVVLAGGTLDVTRSYEGVESPNIMLSGGSVHVIAYDDALNVSRSTSDGGLGDSGQTEPNAALTISGGKLTLIARDDCIDSNGTLTISGGELTLVGSEHGHGALLDSDGEFLVNGGTISGAGRAALSVTPSGASTQGWLVASASGSAGSHVQLLDGMGNVLADYIAHRAFAEFYHSSAGIVPGQVYEIVIDGVHSQVLAGTSGPGSGS